MLNITGTPIFSVAMHVYVCSHAVIIADIHVFRSFSKVHTFEQLRKKYLFYVSIN